VKIPSIALKNGPSLALGPFRAWFHLRSATEVGWLVTEGLPVKPRSYVIIGCGHFGSLAAKKLLHQDAGSRITVVDQDERTLRKISSLAVETLVGEGISCLGQLLSSNRRIDYIIPAVPFHLAFEYILSKLKPFDMERGNVPPLNGLPNVTRGRTGDFYTSLADFLCPEDCPEPSGYCTVTGKRRKKPLYKQLMELTGPFESRLIRSHQLAAGVGGFRPEALNHLPEHLKMRTNVDRLILVSTACRCHGVVSALSSSLRQ